jgi:hypothetical protein
MKTVSQLIAVATFALSASAFAVPSNQEDRLFTQVSEPPQTVAADGSQRTPQGQALAENGRNRLEEQGLVEDGYDKTPQGQAIAADGSDRTPLGEALAADGSDRKPGRRAA